MSDVRHVDSETMSRRSPPLCVSSPLSDSGSPRGPRGVATETDMAIETLRKLVVEVWRGFRDKSCLSGFCIILITVSGCARGASGIVCCVWFTVIPKPVLAEFYFYTYITEIIFSDGFLPHFIYFS